MRLRLSGELRSLLEGLRKGLPVPAQRGFPGLGCPARQAARSGGGSSLLRSRSCSLPHCVVEGRGDVRHALSPEDGARDSATDGAAAPAGRADLPGLTSSRRARILGDERRRRLPVTLRREKSGRVGRGTSDSSVRGSHRAREGGGGGARGGRGAERPIRGEAPSASRTFPGIRGGEELLPGGAPGPVTGLAEAGRKCGIRLFPRDKEFPACLRGTMRCSGRPSAGVPEGG